MLESYFTKFGYSHEKFLRYFKEKTLINKFEKLTNFLFKLGYIKEEVIKMTKINSTLFTHN